MAQVTLQLPIDTDGKCMLCKVQPPEEATLTRVLCATPWHVDCLSFLPENMASALMFECPDCSGEAIDGAPAQIDSEKKDLFARIREIESDDSLMEREKTRKWQHLLSGGKLEDDENGKWKRKAVEENEQKESDLMGLLHQSFKCSYCMELPERPVMV